MKNHGQKRQFAYEYFFIKKPLKNRFEKLRKRQKKHA